MTTKVSVDQLNEEKRQRKVKRAFYYVITFYIM